MDMNQPALTPLVLLVDDQEWTCRSIESILRPKGQVVLKAYTGQQALELVRKVSPDVIMVDFHLPDIDGIDLIRQLRQSATIRPMTPILMMTTSTVGRTERLEALAAGAWDILRHPLDPNELVLRVETFVRAKQEADRIRDQGLTDPGTGFYNVRGLLRRTKEISADAMRSDRPLACIAFGPHSFGEVREGDTETPEMDDLSRGLAWALRSATRISDTIGRLGPGEFVIVAPGTDQDGAVRLADRVMRSLEEAADKGAMRTLTPEELQQVRAGLCAVTSAKPASPEDLLLRATMALRRAQADDSSFRVRSYEA